MYLCAYRGSPGTYTQVFGIARMSVAISPQAELAQTNSALKHDMGRKANVQRTGSAPSRPYRWEGPEVAPARWDADESEAEIGTGSQPFEGLDADE